MKKEILDPKLHIEHEKLKKTHIKMKKLVYKYQLYIKRIELKNRLDKRKIQKLESDNTQSKTLLDRANSTIRRMN